MKVFYKFTRRCLKENKTRTIVTIIGIILSMALFTAVIEGAYSGIVYMRNCEKDGNGSWNGFYENQSMEQFQELANNSQVDVAKACGEVGWAKVESTNEDKPYIRLVSIDESACEIMGVHMEMGRFPQNENEILLSDHLRENGNVEYKVGDVITLSVGKRVSDGYELSIDTGYSKEQESIENTKEMTFTVVGICGRIDDGLEPYNCPGYFAFTTNIKTETVTGLFELKKPETTNDFLVENDYGETYGAHSDLLTFYGVSRYSVINRLIFGFGFILVVLIMFGSISLIYNSFAISVGERTKLFGILKSVGATKKQIRGCIYYEALLLSVIAIPLGLVVGCVGIGTTLWFLRDAFRGFYYSGSATKMQLALNPKLLGVAAFICLITTIISAFIPAKKATRISPIDAIRQNGDVKIQREMVKTSGIVNTLFGFEGMLASKNFKRNKKRYRSVVISLFISVTLFISAASFCSYMSSSIEGVTGNDYSADLVYDLMDDESEISYNDFLNNFLELPSVTQGDYYTRKFVCMRIPEKMMTKQYEEGMASTPIEGEFEVGTNIVFLNDAQFNQVCEQNKLSYEQFYDMDKPQALFINQIEIQCTDSKGNATWTREKLLKDDSFPAEVDEFSLKEMDDYEIWGDAIEKDGQWMYRCYKQSYLSELYQREENVEDIIDINKAKLVPATEVEKRTTHVLAAAITELPIGFNKVENVMIYPYSMRAAFADKEDMYLPKFFLLTTDHNVAAEECREMLISNGYMASGLSDLAASHESTRMMVMVVDVFSYGFIILISLIALANVFNTISTNVNLRRREFAMLRSIGLSEKGFRKTLNYECIIYGLKGLLWGLPAALLMTYWIYNVTGIAYTTHFYVPWYSIVIAIFSVFIVVFTTMAYSWKKVKQDNVIDALKNENL